MMAIMRPDAIRDEGLRELGAKSHLHRIAFDRRGNQRPYEERYRLFEEYKVDLKKKYKKVALECHPDRNLDLTEAERKAKEDRFKRITRAIDFLMTIAPSHPVRRAPQITIARMPAAGVMVINLGGQPMSMGNFRTVTSSTTATPGYWPWHG